MADTQKIDQGKSSIPTDKPSDNSLVHNIDMINTSIFTLKFFVVLIAVVILGLGSGFALSRGKVSKVDVNKGGTVINSSETTKGVVVGSNDTKTFKDAAEGILKGGGINGEGAYHLVRPGGDSQKVYLTSSLIDLSKFLNRKIKVWGETQKAKFAGWLMDVGRVEVLE
jgi:hypothetical protein